MQLRWPTFELQICGRVPKNVLFTPISRNITPSKLSPFDLPLCQVKINMTEISFDTMPIWSRWGPTPQHPAERWFSMGQVRNKPLNLTDLLLWYLGSSGDSFNLLGWSFVGWWVHLSFKFFYNFVQCLKAMRAMMMPMTCWWSCWHINALILEKNELPDAWKQGLLMQFCYLIFCTEHETYWMVQTFQWVTRTPSPIKFPLVAHCPTELPDHDHGDDPLFSEYLDRHEPGPTSNHTGPQGDVTIVESSKAIATQWLMVLCGRDVLPT